MGRRNKQPSKSAEPASGQAAGSPTLTPTRQGHPPAKQPTLLAVSLVLFAVWFVFLLVTALWG